MTAGVSWFEVDRSDVLKAKKKALKQAGAAFSEQENNRGKAAHLDTCPFVVNNLVAWRVYPADRALSTVYRERTSDWSQVGNLIRQPEKIWGALRCKVPSEGSQLHHMFR